eukprot:TRINITY_DN27324_c0_g1_i1.p1 TRINITY_DN27324_c0_g1~~TRINITY_DN27324_c0_g1_i1.p1  ORF type:complete len:175 (+),score=40.99 TRINITY_DN27324_c0_g1_i1:34-558(+)
MDSVQLGHVNVQVQGEYNVVSNESRHSRGGKVVHADRCNGWDEAQEVVGGRDIKSERELTLKDFMKATRQRVQAQQRGKKAKEEESRQQQQHRQQQERSRLAECSSKYITSKSKASHDHSKATTPLVSPPRICQVPRLIPLRDLAGNTKLPQTLTARSACRAHEAQLTDLFKTA